MRKSIGISRIERCVMSGYIRREDAIKTIKENDVCCYCSNTKVLAEIRNLPTIEPKRGEWIRDRYWSRGAGMGEEYGFFYKCSLCEYEVEDGYTRCSFNFCPNCGAKMNL